MENSITHIASLIGEPVRAKILWTLMDGRAYTARELAIGVETTPQNLSMHLGKLLRAGLLSVEAQGRHRYYTFARTEVADAIEAMANLVPAEQALRKDMGAVPIDYCRTCYDHLAGKVGVAITESLVRQKLLVYRDKELDVTPKGVQWFAELGIDCGEIRQQRRAFAKPCLDWTERRHHLAGALGAALLEKMLEAHWLRRSAQSRAVVATAKGRQALEAYFTVQW
ncbi:MAG TPA: winged helix-turn-helix domain-containing protein [Puia sp.]|nr:winged helix-turn-helix domain-containing protein [Puia sp.]